MTAAAVRALLGLGSNLGDRDANIRAALDVLARDGAVRVLSVSALRTTAPVGGPPQPDYRNAAALVETALAPDALLAATQRAEATVGRTPGGERWGPRVVDVDILLYGDAVVATESLRVPHPRMAERRFVLEPAADVAPQMRHPLLGRSVSELLAGLPA